MGRCSKADICMIFCILLVFLSVFLPKETWPGKSVKVKFPIKFVSESL